MRVCSTAFHSVSLFTHWSAQRKQDRYALIRKTVQRVAPFFDDFLLRPNPLAPDFIKLAWKHKGSDKYFGASAISDGSLRFIALATLFLQPLELRPSVIVVDEPELGLHPAAITLLAVLMRQTSTDTQIIASTQSPLLLDHFDPQDATLEDLAHYLGMAKQEVRFVPYVVMHEFEDLLFSDCVSFAEGIGRKELGGEFQKIRDQFATPEEINDSPQTAPSKRVEKLVPGYQKPFLGNLAALEIGLVKMRAECPRFGLWVTGLESLAERTQCVAIT